MGSEILSVLELSRPADHANLGAIREWLQAQICNNGLELDIRDDMPEETDTFECWIETLEKGINRIGDRIPKSKSHLRNAATSEFVTEETDPLESDRRFSALLSLNTQYKNSLPRLTLGTVLRRSLHDASEIRYFLCLQPKCDSVRLDHPTDFPLLQLEIASGSERFNLVAKSDPEGWIHLRYDAKATNLTMVTFQPSSDGRREVLEREGGNGFAFYDAEGSGYTRIAQMKDEHALEVVSQLAASLSRPGPNHAEWLRRASSR